MAIKLIKTGTDGNKYSIPTGRGMPPAEALRILLLIRDTLIFDDEGNLDPEGAIAGADAASAVWGILEENNLMPEVATASNRVKVEKPVEVHGRLGSTITDSARRAAEIARDNPGTEYVLVFNQHRINVTEDAGARVRPDKDIASEYMAMVHADIQAYEASDQAKIDKAERDERNRRAKERLAVALEAIRRAPPGLTRALMLALRDYCSAADDCSPNPSSDDLFDELRARGFKSGDLVCTDSETLKKNSALSGRYIIGQIMTGFFHPILFYFIGVWLENNDA